MDKLYEEGEPTNSVSNGGIDAPESKLGDKVVRRKKKEKKKLSSFKTHLKEARAPWEDFWGKWYNIKRDYGIVITPISRGWNVRIEITGRDTVDLHSLNSVSKDWNQDTDGYTVFIETRANLRKLLKILKSKPLPREFDNG